MTYEELLIDSDRANLIVKEKDIPGYGGRIFKNRIAIHKGLPTSIEKSCVLAEELGHHYTTYGDILDQSEVSNRKQELRARAWGYNKLIGLMGLIKAYEHGCRNRYEIAEYLEVTEEYLEECLECYRSKYGICQVVDNYIGNYQLLLKEIDSVTEVNKKAGLLLKNLETCTIEQIRSLCKDFFTLDRELSMKSTHFKRCVMYIDLCENASF